MNQNLEAAMSLIVYGGDAKSSAMEAIQFAKKGDIENAEKMMQVARSSLVQAHHSQTNLLTREAGGEELSLSLLMVHAQDHLMTSMTFVDLASEIIDIHKNRI